MMLTYGNWPFIQIRCHVDEVLRYSFVYGLRHEAIQCRLLSETDLTTKPWKSHKPWKPPTAMQRPSRDFQHQPVRFLQSNHTKTKSTALPQTCYRCNRPGHNTTTCLNPMHVARRGTLLQLADRSLKANLSSSTHLTKGDVSNQELRKHTRSRLRKPITIPAAMSISYST